MNLSGKVLVVTGSDGAPGRAVAATLGAYGARSDDAQAVTGALIPVGGRP